MKNLIDSARRSSLILAFSCLALVVAFVPLQQRFPMGKLQHYGLAIFIVGLGYIVQVVWSWRSAGRWARIGQLFTGLYICTAALIMYSNPWLDPRFAIRTEAHEQTRAVILAVLGLLAVPLGIFAALWLKEESQATGKGKRTDPS